MIPYAEVIEAADRRWTYPLLDRLRADNTEEKERRQIVEALWATSDPRSVGPLETILNDSTRTAAVRKAASAILRGFNYTTTDPLPHKLRSWWEHGDPILRRHALLNMNGLVCPEIVQQVAADASDELQVEALSCMDYCFERPDQEAIKIAALSHANPKVRAAAAGALLFDEPVAAERPLITAAADPDPEVSVQALSTLKYYPSRRTIRCVHRLLDHSLESIRKQAAESWSEIRNECLITLTARPARIAQRVRIWLQPVWEMLAFTPDELAPDKREPYCPPPEPPKEFVAFGDLLELLGNPDASPKVLQERLWSNAWEAYNASQRSEIRSLLLTQQDPLIRELAATCFEQWQDVDGLQTLVRDSNFLVRKAAMYHLGQIPPAAGVADLAWEHLKRGAAMGVHATEALRTFCHHAPRSDAIPRLATLAADRNELECIRTSAVWHLCEFGATDAIRQLTPSLREPPQCTWSFHIALIDTAGSLHVPTPDLGDLGTVDNLFVQEALAQLS
jgi:HEAT repeat protein